MAEGKGTNVASVGLSLDSSAFNSGVARALADISRLLTGLRELQAASQKTNLGQLGAGRASAGAAFTPAGFARDIQRLAIPAIRQLDRTASSSVVFGGRAARTGGFDPLAMTQAINRQLIPAMQRMSRLADSSASGEWAQKLMAQSNAQRTAMRRLTEEESRRARLYAEGEVKRQERAAERALQAVQAQNRAGTDPLTTRSRAMRARMEEERYIRETGAFRKAHPTPIGTGFPGRGGGSMEGRWGDVSDLRGMPKDWIKVLKQLEAQGWNIGKGNAGHGYAKPVDKNYKPIPFGTTPSDHRALQNFISIARRAGGIVNGRGRTLGDEAFVSNRQPGMYQDPRTGSFTLGAKYAMTSLERMIASTETERGYPQVMQPRPRGSEGQLSESTRKQIASMTRKFEKELIFKPTTNLEEGLVATVGSQAGKEFVLSGSGRTLGMRNILKEHGSAGKAVLSNAVNEYLKNNPGEFGKGEAAALRKEAAALFAAGETPMIVRRLNTPLESMSPKEQGQLGLQLNARTGLSTEEIAHAAARLMGPLPAGLLSGDPRKVIAAGKGEAYSAFKQQLTGEALGPTLAETRFGKGTELRNLMMQTLVARAYGNNNATAEMLTSAYGKEPSALGTTARAALERNLGNQLRLRSRIESGELPAGMDPIFNALPGALKLMQEATTGPQAWISGKQKEGLVGNQVGAVRALLSQKTLFGGKIPREALRLASAMLSVPSGGLGAFLSTITAYGAKAEGAQASLFGEEGGAMKADPRQAVQMSIRAANEYLAQAKGIKGKGKEASAARTALFNSVLENVFSGMAPAAPMTAPAAVPAAVPAAAPAAAPVAAPVAPTPAPN